MYFALVALSIGWFGPYFKEIGFANAEIGIAIGVLTGSKIISPYIWGAIGDRASNRLRIVQVGMAGSIIVATMLLLELTFGSLCLVLLLFGLFWNAIIAQFDTLTLSYLANQHYKYSTIRVWGSVGFILMMLASGWLFSVTTLTHLPHLIIFVLVLSLLLSMALPTPKRKHVSVDRNHSILRVLCEPVVILFFFIVSLNQFAHGPLNVFFTLYVQDHGYTAFEAGQLWALGVFAEVILFFLIPNFIGRLDLKVLLSVSLILTAFRWWMIAWCVDLVAVLILIQLIHALSFGAIHAVSIEFVRRWFPDQFAGRGMALYSGLVFGAGGSLGAMSSGYAWDYLGSEVTFVIAGFISMATAIIAQFGLSSAKLQPQN